MKKRKLWHSQLSATEKRHIKEAGCNLVSSEPFRRNVRWQQANNVHCLDCELIAKKLGLWENEP